jgi:hypothetical protein
MTHAALARAVRVQLAREGVTQSEAAERVGRDVAAVSRALNYAAEAPTLLALADAFLGRRWERELRAVYRRRGPTGRFLPPPKKDAQP